MTVLQQQSDGGVRIPPTTSRAVPWRIARWRSTLELAEAGQKQ